MYIITVTVLGPLASYVHLDTSTVVSTTKKNAGTIPYKLKRASFHDFCAPPTFYELWRTVILKTPKTEKLKTVSAVFSVLRPMPLFLGVF